MRNNNGKIAIAIVAMFVVALSVVGFTYAYFTATVKGNSANESVKVTAGRLEIVYGNGTKLKAQNLVPGWTSDGTHYYDAQYSSTDSNGDGIYEIKAVTTGKYAKKSDNTIPGEADGIANAATFTVSNSVDNTDNNDYIIRLKDITNGLASDDQAYLWVTLKSGNTVVWSGNLSATSETPQVIVPAARTILKDGASQSYSVSLTYQNKDGAQTSKGVGVVATVEVIGVVCSDADKKVCVDADSVPVTFPTANTTEPKIDLTVAD